MLIEECKWIVGLLFVVAEWIILELVLLIAQICGLVTKGLLLIERVYWLILLSESLLVGWVVIYQLLIKYWLLHVRKWELSILLHLIWKALVLWGLRS